MRYYLFSLGAVDGFDNFTEALVYGAFLRIILVLVTTLFSYYIVDRNMIMLNKTIEANADLVHSQEELIFAFAEISESKSKVTGEHIRRVAEYMRILGNASGFTSDYVDKLSVASMMHDIGKLMIPEDILDKPDKLTDEEYAIMKNHVLYGEALLAKCPGDIMQIAKTIALEHHERWDGTGYLGMKENEIAYISRLMAVCDVFDALTSQRYYKDGWSLEDTYNEIVRLSGKHFDPDVVQLFVDNFDEFKRVLKSMPDKEVY
jgi:HD-GYP domain-containing protein (c-di-GMP phosphodiesterase class II)